MASVVIVAGLWSLTHRYQGLGGDAKLYAVQAMARLNSAFVHDVFLQNTSQDQFTIFSTFYAFWIRSFGLHAAELSLTIVFKTWLLAASWYLARELSNRYTAFLALAFVVLVTGNYGAYDVFHYSEDWLTARSPAEAMVVTALACYFRGSKVIGLVIATVALFVHPLMALPGLLLVIALAAPLKVGVLGATAAISGSLALACSALALPPIIHVFSVMDSGWLEIARERSQYLFLQLWSVHDWKTNARPFVTLTIIALVTRDVRIRKLCIAAMIVGASGLAIALIAGLIGPVPILLQGQAWRWVWVASFTSVLLLPLGVQLIWRDNRCGPLCALLLLVGWMFAPIDGTVFSTLALALWSIRRYLTERISLILRVAAVAVFAVAVVWIVANSWTILKSPAVESGREPFFVTVCRNLMGLEALALLLAWSLLHWMSVNRSLAASSTIALSTLALMVFVIPGTFSDVGRSGATASPSEFADWRKIIPRPAAMFLSCRRLYLLHSRGSPWNVPIIYHSINPRELYFHGTRHSKFAADHGSSTALGHKLAGTICTTRATCKCGPIDFFCARANGREPDQRLPRFPARLRCSEREPRFRCTSTHAKTGFGRAGIFTIVDA